MKKIISLLLCFVICLSALTIFGCTDKNDPQYEEIDAPNAVIKVDGLKESDATNATPPANDATITVDGLKNGDEYVPYTSKALDYITAAPGSNVSDFYKQMENPNRPITLEWDFKLGETPDKYRLEYSTNSDLTNAISVSLNSNTTRYDLYNLYKDTVYYCTVSYIKGNRIATVSTTFKTTDLGPRVMSVDGIYNVRDIGGYKTADGKTTAQGLIYRGGSLRPYNNYDSFLTEEGEKVMRDLLGIKTDLDVRGKGDEAGNLTESPIPGASLEYAKLIAYHEIFDVPENVRYIFSLLADEKNYPIYFHCSGGADRTGTLAFLINGLLGVSYEDLIHDYEFTSFSIYKERNSADGTKYGTKFHQFLNILNTYEGNTLSEKIESYLLSIGVTAQEIQNIKKIMLGESSLGGFIPQN